MAIFPDQIKISRRDGHVFHNIFPLTSDLKDSTLRIDEGKQPNAVNKSYKFFSNDNCQLNETFPFIKSESNILKGKECNKIYDKVQKYKIGYIRKDVSYNCNISTENTKFSLGDQVKLIKTWKECELIPLISMIIYKAGYKVPEEIQKYVIPLILKGKNVAVSARAGCGKSISFIISIINSIFAIKSKMGYRSVAKSPFAIIVVPTPELALQFYKIITNLTADLDISCSKVIGGIDFYSNVKEIFQGCDIVVGTMGRLYTMFLYSKLCFNLLKYLIIDELDLFVLEDNSKGLISLMNLISNNLKNLSFQVCTFMSVSSPKITAFLQNWAKNNFITIEENNEIACTEINFINNPNIIHKLYFVKGREEKPNKLLEIIKNIRTKDIVEKSISCTRIIIFTDKINWSKEIKNFICQEMPSEFCEEFNR